MASAVERRRAGSRAFGLCEERDIQRQCEAVKHEQEAKDAQERAPNKQRPILEHNGRGGKHDGDLQERLSVARSCVNSARTDFSLAEI